MANTPVEKVILDLDNKEFVKKLQDSLGLLGQIGKIDSVANLASTFKTIGIVAGISAGAVLAVKTALDLTLEAEKLKAIDKSFNAIAESANVSADVIRSQLKKAIGGLVDETEALKSATKAMVSLGESANRVGEIMELSRKIVKVFGGDLLETFEKVSQSLATGQTRMLRQYGLIIDNDKATKEFAKSIGTSADLLNDAGRRQAIMNEALAQGAKKFEGISISTDNATGSTKKFWAALKDLGDVAVIAFDKVAGNATRQATSDLADTMQGLALRAKKWFGDTKESKEATIELLKRELAETEKVIATAEKYTGVHTEYYKKITKEADALRDKINQINGAEEKASMLQMKRGQAVSQLEKKTPEAGIDTGEQFKNLEETKKLREKFEKDLINLRQQRLASEMQIETDADFATSQMLEQQMFIQAEAEQRIENLKREYLDRGVITEQQYQDARTEIYQDAANRIEEIERQSEQRRLEALERQQDQARTVAQGMSSAFAVEAQRAAMDLKNFGKFGGIVFNSLKSNAASAFASIGDGSKNAGEAMKGFMFGAIADIAEAQGQTMLAHGIGTFNPLEVAQGGVLIALASMLRSQAKGSSELSAGGGGGGGAGMSRSEQEKPEAKEQERKAVNINIHGSYYETEQTRTRLVDMIREAGDATDFNIKQIGQR